MNDYFKNLKCLEWERISQGKETFIVIDTHDHDYVHFSTGIHPQSLDNEGRKREFYTKYYRLTDYERPYSTYKLTTEKNLEGYRYFKIAEEIVENFSLKLTEVPCLRKNKWYLHYNKKYILYITPDGEVEGYTRLTLSNPHEFIDIFSNEKTFLAYAWWWKEPIQIEVAVPFKIDESFFIFSNNKLIGPVQIEVNQPTEIEERWYVLNSNHQLEGPMNQLEAIDTAYCHPN